MSNVFDFKNQDKLFRGKYEDMYILHIPHSSVHIPDRSRYVVSEQQLQNEINYLTDWATERIFDVPGIATVQATFSRVFCDVERFYDEQEPMFAKGAGIVYTKMDSGKQLRQVNSELKQRILDEFYLPHHQKLTQLTQEKLDVHGTVTIIDCHSFSSTTLQREFDQDSERPDICLGTDDYHIPSLLVEEYKSFFEQRGYVVKVDIPYSGTIVPTKFSRQDSRVYSIMIEINKRLYMDEETFKLDEAAVRHLNKLMRELLV